MMVFDRSAIPATILVVEDEMMIRMNTVDMVEDAGYAPIEAEDADGAVAMLESRSDIALMVTDIQMPGSMDGVELARAVHERWPSIKIIVVSGHLKQPIDLPAESRFFGKPLEARDMISQMRNMIDHA
jgi:DNA-binding NtrC family response regulator